jgi:moderate conductance mechanosensitive channel
VFYDAGVWRVIEEIREFARLLPLFRLGLLILVGLVAELAVRIVVPRLSARLAARASGLLDVERQKRGATVVRVGANVVRIMIWTVVFVSLLAQININIGPLLAGAGVVGAALAFGAQNVVKDHLSGFFILLENQYKLGDVVRIGALTGTVEEITMRITVLRGVDGAMHVIPNGAIQTVSNLTSVWARAIVDVSVAHTANVDVALDALAVVGGRFYEDEAWKPRLLEQPEVVGVMKLSDTSVQLRMQVKVKAEEQWKVQYELLRRVKEELDARAVPMPVAVIAPAPARREPT